MPARVLAQAVQDSGVGSLQSRQRVPPAFFGVFALPDALLQRSVRAFRERTGQLGQAFQEAGLHLPVLVALHSPPGLHGRARAAGFRDLEVRARAARRRSREPGFPRGATGAHRLRTEPAQVSRPRLLGEEEALSLGRCSARCAPRDLPKRGSGHRMGRLQGAWLDRLRQARKICRRAGGPTVSPAGSSVVSATKKAGQPWQLLAKAPGIYHAVLPRQSVPSRSEGDVLGLSAGQAPLRRSLSEGAPDPAPVIGGDKLATRALSTQHVASAEAARCPGRSCPQPRRHSPPPFVSPLRPQFSKWPSRPPGVEGGSALLAGAPLPAGLIVSC